MELVQFVTLQILLGYVRDELIEFVFFYVRPAWVQSIGCKSRTVKTEVAVSLTQGCPWRRGI
ncbi:hypothetical protein BACCIP111883_01663 [Sutcliffiella rhizosphaerae]|uniref:Uncharacterized protein n=1 Tax=Sutcliffiella rhizosphaerae TaxID=2880967 RepID=A0ABM8YM36_9BACI|nr:hypothetical protein BACCIP111883_01663 [Sutcliffiella rhizosphaerae]